MTQYRVFTENLANQDNSQIGGFKVSRRKPMK